MAQTHVEELSKKYGITPSGDVGYLPSTSGSNMSVPQEENDFLGGALPWVGGLLGGLISGVPSGFNPVVTGVGSSAGAVTGQGMENSIEDLISLMKGGRGRLGSAENLEDYSKAGATAMTLSQLIPTAGSFLFPNQVLKYRDWLASRNPATVNTEKLLENLLTKTDPSTGKVPAGSEKTYEKLSLRQIDNLSGKDRLNLLEALTRKKTANEGSKYTKGGTVGSAATAKFNKILGDLYRTSIREVAPEVSGADKLYSKGANTRSLLGKIISRFWPFAVGATAGKAF